MRGPGQRGAPKLRRALTAAQQAGHAHVVTDGTLIPIDRVAADRPFYSGRHRRHGMNLQVISAPDGEILRVSGPLPGAVQDLTAARTWGIVLELAAAGLVVQADKGYHVAGDHVLTPYRGQNKPASQKAASRVAGAGAVGVGWACPAGSLRLSGATLAYSARSRRCQVSARKRS